jgi:LPXTG-site transpeptidase (sortase) family protein
MQSELSPYKKVRFCFNVAALYALTIGGGWLLIQPPGRSTPITNAVSTSAVRQKPQAPKVVAITGKPVQITIPDSHIDLAVDEGYYDTSTASWTLSDTHAQYAMMTTPANNLAGNTFIYGHGTNAVFGTLNDQAPIANTQALIATDNHHVFSYRFQSSRKLTPNDISALDPYDGPPILTIQTCTGSLSEWRTMFVFRFERIIS